MPLQQLANALGGFSAGVSGNLIPFQQQQAQQREKTALAQQKARESAAERQKALLVDGARMFDFAKQGNFQAVADITNARLQEAQNFPGVDFSDTQNMSVMAQRAAAGDQEAAQALTGFLERGADVAKGLGLIEDTAAKKGTEQLAFESLLESGDLTDEEKKKAIKVKLGLEGKAVSNAILSAIASGDIDSLTDAKAKMKQAEKFAELTGSSRAKAIDSGFEKVNKIDTGIRNIDRAIAAVEAGAGVGAIESKFPSLKAASVELDNIQGSMALDVVGATTFGALSKGELDLAKEVALPTGLDGPELIDHLQRKKVAQEKLRAYYNEQIQFLDQGGTVAGFLRMKEREQGDQPQANPQDQGGIEQQGAPVQAQRLVYDPATGQLVPK